MDCRADYLLQLHLVQIATAKAGRILVMLLGWGGWGLATGGERCREGCTGGCRGCCRSGHLLHRQMATVGYDLLLVKVVKLELARLVQTETPVFHVVH